jgi:hypothetical protein
VTHFSDTQWAPGGRGTLPPFLPFNYSPLLPSFLPPLPPSVCMSAEELEAFEDGMVPDVRFEVNFDIEAGGGGSLGLGDE